MSDKENSSLGKIIIGTIVGGLFGIFFAPKSGKQTRHDLRDDLDNYLGKVKDAYDNLITQAEKTAEEIENKAEQLSALIDKYGDDSIDEYLEKIENEINALKNGVATAVKVYRNSKTSQMASGEIADDIFIDFVNENSEEE